MANERAREAPIGERHAAVLREALRLFAERGYAGASLRELARRVGVKQPSLYHYFTSKDELVEQLIEHIPTLIETSAEIPPPPTLGAVPPLLSQLVLYLYRETDWRLFVRFVLSLSLSEPRFAPQLRRLFVERTGRVVSELMGPFIARGEIRETDARLVVHATINAVGLAMIEQTILYPGEPAGIDADELAAYVGALVTRGLGAA
ncbi:MAG: TetR/AcrR family transcriptional regulator [Sandaracinaceae bacterium]|nr:TetR/AcrR family transcriptional regulator [Sandaracinaceae bacterium]